MIDISKIKPGDKVHYWPAHYIKQDKHENGMVKSLAPNGGVFVVYNCGGDWDNYREFTAANTKAHDLFYDWK